MQGSVLGLNDTIYSTTLDWNYITLHADDKRLYKVQLGIW